MTNLCPAYCERWSATFHCAKPVGHNGRHSGSGITAITYHNGPAPTLDWSDGETGAQGVLILRNEQPPINTIPDSEATSIG